MVVVNATAAMKLQQYPFPSLGTNSIRALSLRIRCRPYPPPNGHLHEADVNEWIHLFPDASLGRQLRCACNRSLFTLDNHITACSEGKLIFGLTREKRLTKMLRIKLAVIGRL